MKEWLLGASKGNGMGQQKANGLGIYSSGVDNL